MECVQYGLKRCAVVNSDGFNLDWQFSLQMMKPRVVLTLELKRLVSCHNLC